MNAPVLELEEVTKRYDRRAVLDGLTLRVPRGCVLGLLGKNGSGKSTLIKIALDLVKPQAGKVTILGEPAWTLSDGAKARLGYMPQVHSHYPWMRVGKLINYTASFYPRWNISLVEKMIDLFELDLHQRVRELSVGQAQQVSIVLALGHEPELLILDEPVASLDPAARRDFLKTVLDVSASGERTVLLASHITSDIERVADQVAILKDGRTTYGGALDALKESVKRLHIAARRPLPAEFRVPGLLHADVKGQEARVGVRDLTPALLRNIELEWDAKVEVQDLGLEDIFLELTHGK